jgi:hypothetical protein
MAKPGCGPRWTAVGPMLLVFVIMSDCFYNQLLWIMKNASMNISINFTSMIFRKENYFCQ